MSVHPVIAACSHPELAFAPSFGCQKIVKRAARLANLENGGVHILRHTFCSHLAMKGAPARAIQELAGHADLGTTQRYMHLSPRAVEDAIRLLERSTPVSRFGDIMETGTPPNLKSLGGN